MAEEAEKKRFVHVLPLNISTRYTSGTVLGTRQRTRQTDAWTVVLMVHCGKNDAEQVDTR